MRFYVGIHQPSDAKHLNEVFVSINRLRGRKSAFTTKPWILDSGAFTTLQTHGGYPEHPKAYAAEVNRIAAFSPSLIAAVTQDYMCEEFMLAITGRTIQEHQRLTILRYDEIKRHLRGTYLMPVLQGYAPSDYTAHLAQYGPRLASGAYVGVGSVCKRNTKPYEVLAVLDAIKTVRSDLLLHGFGLKISSLQMPQIRDLLYSADSMAWSLAARGQRRQNDWRMAAEFATQLQGRAARSLIALHAFFRRP